MADLNPRMLFPTDEFNNLSYEFVIPDEYLGLIQIKNHPDCAIIRLEYHFGVDCDFSWEPVIWCGEEMTICYPSTNFIVPIPGRYRLFLDTENDEHILDPTFFDDMRIQFRLIKPAHDVSDYYTRCCACCDD